MKSCLQRTILLLSAASLLLSCQMRPITVLSKDDMVGILFDIQKAESTLAIVAPYSYRVEKQECYARVFEKHGVTREQFERSVVWYSQNPKKYQLVYDGVLERVKACQAEVEQRNTDELLVSDAYSGDLSGQDSVDIWMWRDKMLLRRRDSYGISRDSVNFSIRDSVFFSEGMRLRWSFLMRLKSVSGDSVPDSVTMRLTARYSNGLCDTVSHIFSADSRLHYICFPYRSRDSLSLNDLHFSFADSLQRVFRLEVDSIRLLRITQGEENRLPEQAFRRIRESRDSCQRRQNAIESDRRREMMRRNGRFQPAIYKRNRNIKVKN